MRDAHIKNATNKAPAARPALAPFPVSRALILTDEELGKLLLEWFTTCEAAKQGLESLDPQFAQSVRRRLLKGGPENASLAAVEESLRLAARGDSARAGQCFRPFIREAGNHARLMRHVSAGGEPARRSGGKTAGSGRKDTVAAREAAVTGYTAAGTSRKLAGEEIQARVLNERHRLLNAGTAIRALPRAIATRLDLDVHLVREIIRTAGLKGS